MGGGLTERGEYLKLLLRGEGLVGEGGLIEKGAEWSFYSIIELITFSVYNYTFVMKENECRYRRKAYPTNLYIKPSKQPFIMSSLNQSKRNEASSSARFFL